MRSVIRIIGGLYGISGLAFLPYLTMNLFYGSGLFFSPGLDVRTLLVTLGVPFSMMIVHFLLLNSLYGLKRWGRYLAITYNSIWLVVIASAMTLGFIIEPDDPPASLAGVLFLLVPGLFLGGTLVIFMKQDVKNLMCN